MLWAAPEAQGWFPPGAQNPGLTPRMVSEQWVVLSPSRLPAQQCSASPLELGWASPETPPALQMGTDCPGLTHLEPCPHPLVFAVAEGEDPQLRAGPWGCTA